MFMTSEPHHGLVRSYRHARILLTALSSIQQGAHRILHGNKNSTLPHWKSCRNWTDFHQPSLQVMRLMAAIYESARTGQMVKV